MSKPEVNTRRFKDLGSLQDLLLKACPPDENNTRSIPILAEALGLTAYAVYRWIEQGKIPADRASQCVALGKGKLVKIEDFHKFVFA